EQTERQIEKLLSLMQLSQVDFSTVLCCCIQLLITMSVCKPHHLHKTRSVLQILNPQFDCAMVDVVYQQLKHCGAHVLQLNNAVVRLFEVGSEHGAKETALCREHQPVQLKLFAVHSDGDISKQAIFQAQVHDALHHTARMRAVSECVAQEVVLLSHGAPDAEASLLAGLHLCCFSRGKPNQHY
ncbi:unnamed protein product, partial [Menidia menidia]